jgi:hypothetical protein
LPSTDRDDVKVKLPTFVRNNTEGYELDHTIQ